MTQDECWQKCYQEIYTLIKKESHRTMKLFSQRADNGFHNSRQVAKCPTNLVHGIAGAKPAARYDSPVSDFQSQLGYAQDLGREPLLTGQ